MKVLRDENGQTLFIVILSMTVLLGFVAFATDVGVLLRESRAAQSAADSAALAAATESLKESTPTTVTAGMWKSASNDAALNGFTAGSSNGTASSGGTTLTLLISPNITAPGFNSKGYVQAVLTHATPTFFMNLFNFHSMNVTATAVASDKISSNGCIYVQNPNDYASVNAIDMGGNSLISSPTCGVTVNGNLTMTGNPSINALFVAASGTITGKNAESTWAEGVPPQGDPLPQLQETSNQPMVNTSAKTCTLPAAAAAAGMSCVYDYNGGVLTGTLPSNTVFVFDEAGGPSVSGAVSGSGDMIYLVGNIPFDFANNGTVSLTPWEPTATKSNPNPTCQSVTPTNPYCGILLDAPTDGSNGAGTYTCSHGKGNNAGNPAELYFDFGSSTATLSGIVYAPYAQLFMQDEGSSVTMDNDLVIGNICDQSAKLTVNGFSGGGSPLTRAGLVF